MGICGRCNIVAAEALTVSFLAETEAAVVSDFTSEEAAGWFCLSDFSLQFVHRTASKSSDGRRFFIGN